MKITSISRTWKIVLALGTMALLATTLFAIQSLFAVGTLVPFAAPTDNPDNDFLFFEVGIPHSATSNWHYHPGDLYGVVRQGTLTENLGCGRVKDFPAGTAFHDPAGVVHQVSNTGQMEVQWTGFQINHHGDPINVPASEPTCP
jgi:quercetin dioxygenase-like cupin family protein